MEFLIRSIVLLLLFVGPKNSFGLNKSVCFNRDYRFLSNDARVGRVQKPDGKSGCTATMIGRVCAISAGHCHRKYEDLHFNVPLSSKEGKINLSSSEDIYPVIKDSIVFSEEQKGNDYGVFRLRANSITGIYPGDAQGYYSIRKYSVAPGTYIRVIGYGADRDEGHQERNYAQQTSYSRINEVEPSFITYQADTWGGSSGSPVLDLNDQIIGIHTHGDCDESGGRNSGTLIYRSPELMRAIYQCLSWEYNNL
jgi:V8-like Glu-specific endopeptidase